MEDIYAKNYNSLKKELEENTRKWKDLPCSWVGKINKVKNGNLTKSHLQNQCNAYINPSKIFHGTQKKSTQLHVKKQKSQDSQNNPVR